MLIERILIDGANYLYIECDCNNNEDFEHLDTMIISHTPPTT